MGLYGLSMEDWTAANGNVCKGAKNVSICKSCYKFPCGKLERPGHSERLSKLRWSHWQILHERIKSQVHLGFMVTSNFLRCQSQHLCTKYCESTSSLLSSVSYVSFTVYLQRIECEFPLTCWSAIKSSHWTPSSVRNTVLWSQKLFSFRKTKKVQVQ